MWVFICYGEKTKCNFMLLLESIHCAVTTPAGRKWCVHYIEPIRPFRWRNLTNGAEVCCLMSFLPVAVIFMRPVYIVLFYCLRGPHLPCVFVHFFFSCLSCDTTVLSGYVTYLKLFFFHHSFPCVCWSNRVKKSCAVGMLICHNSNNISTHRLFIQCFWELVSVMLLLFFLLGIFYLHAI